jgi:hypothetical protein
MENIKVKEIKEKVEYLINEAITLLENNYDMENANVDNPAYATMMDLNAALMELDWLNEESLKLKNN